MFLSHWFADFSWVGFFQIVWIDLLLSGDNAMVIALACRQLPPRQRKWGAILGAGAAVALRVVFTAFVSQLMNVPWLKLIGGLLLFWIALKLLLEKEEEEHAVSEAKTIRSAVWTIVVADAVMSLDNVIAIAAAAKGHFGLVVFGLLLSIPLVVAGSRVVMWVMDRFVVVIWAGAALLGWLAGGMIAHEAAVAQRLAGVAHAELLAQIAGAVLVIASGWIWDRWLDRKVGAD